MNKITLLDITNSTECDYIILIYDMSCFCLQITNSSKVVCLYMINHDSTTVDKIKKP